MQEARVAGRVRVAAVRPPGAPGEWSGQRSAETTQLALRHKRRSHRDRRRKRNIGIGIGAAILGGAIASRAARANHSAMQRCAQTYRSFDWETGTYVTYGGDVVLCPYLR